MFSSTWLEFDLQGNYAILQKFRVGIEKKQHPQWLRIQRCFCICVVFPWSLNKMIWSTITSIRKRSTISLFSEEFFMSLRHCSWYAWGLRFVSQTDKEKQLAANTNKRVTGNNSAATCQFILLSNSTLKIPEPGNLPLGPFRAFKGLSWDESC